MVVVRRSHRPSRPGTTGEYVKMFEPISELRIGSIMEVAGTAIRIELEGRITELTRTYGGRVYPIGQFGSVVKIHFGRRVLFAYVRLLRMRSELAREEGHALPSAGEDSRIIEADLFAEGVWDERGACLAFQRGVRNYPLPGQSVHLTTQDELRKLFEGAEGRRKDGLSPMLAIGSYVGAAGALCYANLDKLFGMHSAVLGSTGAGKSGTVAALVHSLLDHKPNGEGGAANRLRPRLLLVDPHGEYARAFGQRAAVYRAYDVLAGQLPYASKLLRLPYWIMTGEEFRDLLIGKTEWEATSENNIVFKALTHARQVARGWIKKSETWQDKAVGEIADPAAPRALRDDPALNALIAQYNPDTPDPFSLDEFVAHVREEQGLRIKNSKWEAMSPSDFKPYASVLDKLSVLRTDPRLKFMMAEFAAGQPDLPEILEQFVGRIEPGPGSTENVDVRIIDISGLPNEVAGPLAASVARLIFEYKIWQTREERELDPVLLVCEEAHRYVPDVGLAEYHSAQKAIRRIAKEGRKYGIGLMLISQRPSDVERTVLSQCSSWLVMRLTNATDQEHVTRYLPDSLAGLARVLPSLARQEAVFVGEAAAVPARISIRDLKKEQLPDSGDISFVKGWSQAPVDRPAIQAVVRRWRRETDN